MLARISAKPRRQAASAAQRCLAVRYSSSQLSESTFPSPQNEPPQTLTEGSSNVDHPTPSGFKPKDAYRHPESKSLDAKLPAPALRSLFALHHASRSFITPQTLDKAIDAAFATSNHLTSRPTRVEKSLRDLHKNVEMRRVEDHQNHPYGAKGRAEMEQRDQKKLRELETYGAGMRTSDGGSMPVPIHGQALMHQSSARELEVRAALYGVEQTGEATMPGLDSLEDELAAKNQESSSGKPAPLEGQENSAQGAKSAP